MEQGQTKATNYRPDIDGLRAVAITSVVAYHVGIPGFSGGFVGVDIFFCISGFLIASIILRDVDDGTFTFKGFYARRFRRILPALFLTIGVTYFLSVALLSPAELSRLSVSGIAAIAGISNFHFRRELNYFAPAAQTYPLLMTWSLAVEEQFYLLLPPTLLLIRKVANRWRAAFMVGLTAGSLCLSAVLTPRMTAASFYLLPCRGWELGFGVLLALWRRPRSRSSPGLPIWLTEASSLAGATLIGLSIVGFNDRTLVPGVAVLLPVVGTALLILAPSAGLNRQVLASKPFVFIGLISYSWYLWHWPMLSLVRTIATKELTLPLAAIVGALSFALGIASWRFVETPFRAARRPDGATLLRYGAAAAVLAVGLAVAALTVGLPARFSSQAVSAMTPVRTSDGCIRSHGQTEPRLDATCAEGGPNAIALVGDSHADALAPGLHLWAKDRGLAFVQFTKAGCPILDGVTHYRRSEPAVAPECALFQTKVLEQLLERPDIRTVFLAAYWSLGLDDRDDWFYAPSNFTGDTVSPAQSAAFLRSGLSSIMAKLSRAGKTVFVYQDVPVFRFDPARRAALRYIPARRGLVRVLEGPLDSEWLRPRASMVEVKTDLARTTIEEICANGAVTVLNPQSVLCDGDSCAYGEDEQLYYADSNHLSATGAIKVVAELNDSASKR